eukprot:7387529-Prymnesium_polylepis.1
MSTALVRGERVRGTGVRCLGHVHRGSAEGVRVCTATARGRRQRADAADASHARAGARGGTCTWCDVHVGWRARGVTCTYGYFGDRRKTWYVTPDPPKSAARE